MELPTGTSTAVELEKRKGGGGGGGKGGSKGGSKVGSASSNSSTPLNLSFSPLPWLLDGYPNTLPNRDQCRQRSTLILGAIPTVDDFGIMGIVLVTIIAISTGVVVDGI
jgi:hypothetical protein